MYAAKQLATINQLVSDVQELKIIESDIQKLKKIELEQDALIKQQRQEIELLQKLVAQMKAPPTVTSDADVQRMKSQSEKMVADTRVLLAKCESMLAETKKAQPSQELVDHLQKLERQMQTEVTAKPRKNRETSKSRESISLKDALKEEPAPVKKDKEK